MVDLNKGKRVPNNLSEITQKRRVRQFWLQYFSFAKSVTIFPLLFTLQHHSRNVLRNYSNQIHADRTRREFAEEMTKNNRCFASAFLLSNVRSWEKMKKVFVKCFFTVLIFEIVAIFFVKSFSVYANLKLKEPEWNRTSRRS